MINSTSNVTATLTVTDSRGLTATKTVTVQMVAWNQPSAIITTERVSNFYSETDVTVDASYTQIGSSTCTINLTGKAVPITGKTTPSDVTAALSDNVTQQLVFDNEFEWNLTIVLTDSFGGTTTYKTFLSRGIPLAFFDRYKESVGINMFPLHDDSLEVAGDIYTYGANASDVVLECKNLLKNTARTLTTNGITFTVLDDGSVRANGTATADAGLTIVFTLLNGNYYFNGCPSGGSNSKYNVYVWDVTANARAKKWDKTTNVTNDIGSGSQEVYIDNAHSYQMTMRVMSGQTVSNIVFKPMIRLASITDDTYVPYAMTNRELTEITSPTVTVTKTSGAWNTSSASCRISGNVAHLVITLAGTGTAVSAGSNAFVGTVSGIAPIISASLVGYVSSFAIVAQLATDGTLTVRLTGSGSSTLASGSTATIRGAFICA